MNFRRILRWLPRRIPSLSVLFLSMLPSAAQDIETLKKSAPKVYIDCRGWCDLEYIRTEITFVNHVRDRKEADVHILITTQGTGSGGTEFTLACIGQGTFAGEDHSSTYFSKETDTEDEIRAGLVKALKMGLMPYVSRTPIRDRIAISFNEKVQPTSVEDRWNFWVFSISGNGFANGEESYKSASIYVNLSANRVTPGWKFRSSLSLSHHGSRYSYGDQTIRSSSDSRTFRGLLVKSLGEHWSAGGFLSAYASTYENIGLTLSPAPAIEYDLFPYSESTRRQLRFLYRIGYNNVRYREETIYDKLKENLWSQELSVALEMKEKWGSISGSFDASHYLHDFGKNRLQVDSSISWRLIKGLSLNIFGGVSRVHDQLSLAKGQASLEEVLLRRKMIATSYNYFCSIGLSYTFGSIYSNVVNPRFGTGGGGMVIRY